VDPGGTLETLEVIEGGGGTRTVRFGQRVDDVPVFGAQYLVHMRKTSGGLEAEAVNGHVFTELDVATSPKVSVATARQLAATRVRPMIVARSEYKGLTVLPAGEGVLSHRFTLWGSHRGAVAQQEIFINAKNGSTSLSYSGIRPVTPTTAPGRTAHGDTRTLQVFDRSGSLEMRDRSRTMWPGGEITTHDVKFSPFYDAVASNIERTGGNNFNNVDAFGAAVDAHHGAGETYEYFLELGRDSIDDNGMDIKSSVHYSEGNGPYCNAFWDGAQMVYGDCDPSETYPMSADLDVVGHELTHGVTQFTADLVYLNQSGAINEAISDYFGNAIDNRDTGLATSAPDSGEIGEDLCKVANPTNWECPLRDMNDGRTTGDYLFYLADFDLGGVHDNSTIFSGALWDIREELGDERTDEIVYRALSEYMTPLDSFVDGRNAVLAAADEDDVDPSELPAIIAAFDAKGIVPGWDIGGPNDAEILAGNLAPFGFMFSEGPEATSERYVTGDYKDMKDFCCKPVEIYVGRVDTPGGLKKMSGSPGPNVVSDETPAISGTRAVWARVTQGFFGLDSNVVGRVLGGDLKTLAKGPAQQWFPAIDGPVLAWEDTRAGDTNIWVRRLGKTPKRLTTGGGEQWMPDVSGNWVAWWDIGSGSRAEQIGLKNFKTGRTMQIKSANPSARLGPPALGPDHMVWYQDNNGDGRGAIMKMRLGSNARTTIVADGPDSPRWEGYVGLPLVDANATYAVYTDERGYLNNGPASEVGRDVWMVPLAGEETAVAVKVTDNRGDQAWPQLATGRRAIWLDSARARTDLVTRIVP
jgi:bacillolysin